MDNKDKKGSDWIGIIFLFIILPTAFTVGGVWVGIAVLVIGVLALGWKKRYEPLTPRKKSEND